MKVFVSQSKSRSLRLAQALAPFVRKVVPGTEPWVSDTGIEKGSRFLAEIRENLGTAAAGIVCLTRENLVEPWILYESGALSTKASDRVWTLLLDVTPTDVADPLKGLNHTAADKGEVFKMMASIHATAAASGRTCSTTDLEQYFEAFWPELERVITELKAEDPAPPLQPDPQQEILDALRAVLGYASDDAWRVRKILAMQHVMYHGIVGQAAPSLKVLTSVVNKQQAKAAEEALAEISSEHPPTTPLEKLQAEMMRRELAGEPLD